MKTAHPKILRSLDPVRSEFEVGRALRALKVILAAGDAAAARTKVLRWVGESLIGEGTDGSPSLRPTPDGYSKASVDECNC